MSIITRATFLFALGIALAAGVRATTVVAPTFDELVSGSELVFRGRVVARESRWTGQGKHQRIVTRVTFAVERTLRGEAGEGLVLEFLGGRVGGRSQRLLGWPELEVGDHGVFFVENRTARLCPLMRLRHGRYRIASGDPAGTRHILRDDHTPLRVVADVSRPLNESSSPARAAFAGAALTLESFEAQILERSATHAVPESVR